jgi:hypothetical protein
MLSRSVNTEFRGGITWKHNPVFCDFTRNHLHETRYNANSVGLALV